MMNDLFKLATLAVEAQELLEKTGAPHDRYAAKLARDARLEEFRAALVPDGKWVETARTIFTLLKEKREMEEALQLAERADQQHITCPDCDGLGAAEECGTCVILADESRTTRWKVLGINQKESAKVLKFDRALTPTPGE
jgi:hypothetical protein